VIPRRDRITVHAYPAMLYLGAVCGIIAASRWAEFHGLPGPTVFGVMLLLFLPALVGARLLFVVFHWELYRRHPSRIWERTGGGAALYGGLVVSFLVSLPLLRVLAIHALAFWDAGAIALLIGLASTKFGCLLHGCCAGRPANSFLAFYLPGARGVWCRRLPAQLFEAGLAGGVLLGSIEIANRLPFEGSLFLSSLAGYAGGRWILEPTREIIDRAGRWSLNRIISAALLVIAATVFVFLWVLRIRTLPGGR
jgi:phosphatidylglycerol---prolipoprotein diacylglyceryl transferase